MDSLLLPPCSMSERRRKVRRERPHSTESRRKPHLDGHTGRKVIQNHGLGHPHDPKSWQKVGIQAYIFYFHAHTKMAFPILRRPPNAQSSFPRFVKSPQHVNGGAVLNPPKVCRCSCNHSMACLPVLDNTHAHRDQRSLCISTSCKQASAQISLPDITGLSHYY